MECKHCGKNDELVDAGRWDCPGPCRGPICADCEKTPCPPVITLRNTIMPPKRKKKEKNTKPKKKQRDRDTSPIRMDKRYWVAVKKDDIKVKIFRTKLAAKAYIELALERNDEAFSWKTEKSRNRIVYTCERGRWTLWRKYIS